MQAMWHFKMRALRCFIVGVLLHFSLALKMNRPWTTQQWCQSVILPHWPFAYNKVSLQAMEEKGRVASNLQNMGHYCVTQGAYTKCFICEPIQCGSGVRNALCNYQIQGIPPENLPSNIPTVSDAPWAVGGVHRYDFGGGSHACVLLSGGDCIRHDKSDYSSCKVRCWGYGYPRPTSFNDAWSFPDSVRWTYSKNVGQPQGFVDTLAGGIGSGFQDGPKNQALFNNPQSVTVDRNRNIYVADSYNHAIRKVTPVGYVSTIAGTGNNEPFIDGPALTATFSYPGSITLYYDQTQTLILIVADTGNHKIRKIMNGVVSTLSGLKGQTHPQPGFADGVPTFARFNNPTGVAAYHDGTVFVADRDNHLIRQIDVFGNTVTLAGTLEASSDIPGCVAPCLRGVPGFDDGNLTSAKFNSPRDVAIGLNFTVLVTDDDRIREVNYRNIDSTIQGVESLNRVVTIAGGLVDGDHDGYGQEARFRDPQGLMMSPDGRIYVADTSSCRIRSITSSEQVSVPITCSTTAVEVVRPSGCLSYDPPVGAYEIKVSQSAGNIYYNYNQTTNILQDGEYVALGRLIKDCQGVPPFQIGKEFNGVTIGPQGGTVVIPLNHKEDTDDSTDIKLKCPPGCSSGAVRVWGDGIYTDYSQVCQAAIHAGAIGPSGGIIVLTLHTGSQSYASSTRNGITSLSRTTQWYRGFTVKQYKLALVEVQTVSGIPAANLAEVCGYKDTRPPQDAQFDRLTNVAMFINATLTDTEYLYIADEQNHAIRRMSAVCSQTCENGGKCVAPEKCQCTSGWTGTDCTTPICGTPCTGRSICTSPNTCSCIPGYTGMPSCNTPLCVQTCEHGGNCVAPDTCGCQRGWFDANCTTTVCTQTCGNGGNCTAPDTCTCPTEWQGNDCRTPVCTQPCLNGGKCIAPDTCMCTPTYSGFDCSNPICNQGFLVIDNTLPPKPTYYPCSVQSWCNSTNDFDCKQINRVGSLLSVGYGNQRSVTGHKNNPGPCVMLEVTTTADTYFQYLDATHAVTSYYHHTPLTPYAWDGGKHDVWNSPSVSLSDRQVAFAELRLIPQGKYVCANGGDCPLPDICKCDSSWVGFDCRIPVCHQGYFEEGQDRRLPLWGSRYTTWKGGPNGQGGYECSIRAHTPWERYECHMATLTCDSYVHQAENFYTRYMDGDTAFLAQWGIWAPPEPYGWPPLHFKRAALGNNTDEGWRRDGWWEKTGQEWKKGKCTPDYKRTCTGDPTKVPELWSSLPASTITPDTDTTYRAVITQTDQRTIASGRWFVPGGECIDQVLRGCYNNGTCVAPDTCLCQPGWTGFNCRTPLCQQTCHNFGNCTLPNTCTCEKGWSGYDCTIPLCAQECNNGGKCVAPDTCQCVTWPSKWHDRREAGGRPLFRQPNGDPQLTGWTGYDCATPICTQAKQFILNNAAGTVRLGGYGMILYGDEPTNNLEGQPPPPPYKYTKTLLPGDGQVIRNDGHSFQTGCLSTSGRTSITDLCGKLIWYQGDYILGRYPRVNYNFFQRDPTNPEHWFQGPITPGEGIYACYNHGSCIKPDTCTCPDGWTGYDCNIPLCHHLQPKLDQYGNATIVSCLNSGICAGKDDCHCIKTPTLLQYYPDENHNDLAWEQSMDFKVNGTGYNGSDCSIPMCVQGWFDPFCQDVASGGEGCFRCANGGNCTAPDFCTCTPQWTGFDCRTPVCYYEATRDTVYELNTMDPLRVLAFEQDPCRTSLKEMYNGAFIGHGNCTEPGICQCLCKKLAPFDKDGSMIEEPWKDPLKRKLPPSVRYGSLDCLDGYEGYKDYYGRFNTCHYTIKVPTWWERNTVALIVVGVLFSILFSIAYYQVRKYLRKKRLMEKIEKRRSRRSSELDKEAPPPPPPPAKARKRKT